MDQGLLDEFSAECGLDTSFCVEVGFKGEPTPQVHEFRQPFLVVGRRAGSDLMLDHWLVSRRHAYLQLIEGRFFCVDLGSRTGTHGGDATERSGWLDPDRPIQIGPYSVRPRVQQIPDRDYPPLPVVTWNLPSSEDQPSRWTMNRGLALVGRSPACRIRIAEPDVSRFHCGLVLTSSGVWVVDLQSQRPITLNGDVVRFARVGEGDELRVGRHLLTAEYDFGPVRSATNRARSAPGASPTIPFVVARPPESHDQLPALTPTVLVPDQIWSRPSSPGELNPSDAAALAHPSVNALVQLIGAMQQQMFDQFHQSMMVMFERFAEMHQESSASLREEFEEVRKLSSEIESLKAETARLAEATTLSMQESAFDKASQVPAREPRPAADRNGSTSKPPPTKVVTPLPDPHVDFHAQLCERLSSIETERQNRWQKILGMMSAKS